MTGVQTCALPISDYMILPHDIREALRAPLAGDDLVGGAQVKEKVRGKVRGSDKRENVIQSFFRVGRRHLSRSRVPTLRFARGKKSGQALHGTGRTSLPLLPSGPGGVHAPAHAWHLAGAEHAAPGSGRKHNQLPAGAGTAGAPGAPAFVEIG